MFISNLTKVIYFVNLTFNNITVSCCMINFVNENNSNGKTNSCEEN